MPRIHRLLSSLLISATLFACGTDVTGGGNAEGGTWASYCDTRAQACGISAQTCKTRETCAKDLLRDDIESNLFACLASTCDENICFQQIMAESTPSIAGQAFHTAWQSYINACPTGNDDVEMATWIVADERLDDYQACAETNGCNEAAACFALLDKNVCTEWF